ncbi:hypothetical protein EJ110_NYTH29743 [Nymphaea thermarum]|nr:hypothetical protein EJ110_NYTH29743 [Nymphaea thermarum]
MKYAKKAWIAAAGVGAALGLKYQTVKPTSTLKATQWRATRPLRGSRQASPVSGHPPAKGRIGGEESMRTVVYLSCWGPN